jgi:hypothetical protein
MLINFDMIPLGTAIFDQLPGVKFPGTPRIIKPTLDTASGTQALANTIPGEEFNSRPLVIEFDVPQLFVRANVGLNQSSTAPVNASLRALDAAGKLVTQDGPIAIGPGPTAIRTVMQVKSMPATIKRVELEFSNAFVEVIDSLEFDAAGPLGPPDTTPPLVAIVQPTNGARLTTEQFILEANIKETRKLKRASITIENTATETFELSFFGSPPNYRIGPLWVGSLSPGSNNIRLTAEDFGGNTASATISVRRDPIEGRLVLPDMPVEIPRIPRQAVVQVQLNETFEGSLQGRNDIIIRATEPVDVRGIGHIRDPLNQPLPRIDLIIRAGPKTPLRPSSVTIEAVEAANGRVIDRASFRATITPGRPIPCPPGNILLYYAVPLPFLTREINTAINEKFMDQTDAKPIGDMDVRFGHSVLEVNQTYRAKRSKAGIEFSSRIDLRASLQPMLEGGRILFNYVLYDTTAKDVVPQFVKNMFENEFDAEFKNAFQEQLGIRINEKIGNRALPFVKDIYVVSTEFGIGFCVPIQAYGEFPDNPFV